MGEITVIEYFLTYLWTALDYVGATFLFDGFATRRFKRLAFWGITGSYILFESMVLNLIMPATANYRMVLFALIFYAIFYIVQYNSTVIFCFFMAVICYAISCCVDDMCYTSLFLFTKTNFVSTFFLPFTVRCITVAICYLQKRLRTKNGALPANWKTYIVPMLISLANILLVFYFGASFRCGQMAEKPLFVCALFLTSIQVAALFLVSWMEQNAHFREEALSLQTKAKAQQENIDALSAAYAQQRKLTHDFHAHLDLLAAFLNREDGTENARNYIRNLQKTTITRLLLVSTKNTSMDALLNQKALLAKKRNIDIQFMVNDLSPLKLSIVDLTVIISNIFDNAIEACEKLPEEERQIRVQVLLEEEELFFSVHNRSLPVSIQPGQLPPSTKENPTLHGYGLENVRSILKKYKAVYTMEYQEGWVYFATELPNTLLS